MSINTRFLFVNLSLLSTFLNEQLGLRDFSYKINNLEWNKYILIIIIKNNYILPVTHLGTLLQTSLSLQVDLKYSILKTQLAFIIYIIA